MSPPREWPLALWQSRGGGTTTALQLYWLLCFWLLQHTGRHRRPTLLLFFAPFGSSICPLYTKPWTSAFEGTVVRTAKLHFSFFLFYFLVCVCVCTGRFSPRSAARATFHVSESCRKASRCQRFPSHPSSCWKRGRACKWNTQTLYPSIPALSKSALLDSLLALFSIRFILPCLFCF